MRRFFGVVTEARSYRNLAYLLLGLPLGTVWFSVFVTALCVLQVALRRLTRAAMTVERGAATALLGAELDPVPHDRARWQEVVYLLLRFPAGIVTFTVAVAAVGVPVAVVAHSWALVPVAPLLLIAGMHVVNAVAGACRRWATTALVTSPRPA